jgi:hypothetical protein
VGVGDAKERGGMDHREEKEKGYDRERTSDGISGEKSIFTAYCFVARGKFIDRNHVAGLFTFQCQFGSRSDMEIGIHLFFHNREMSIIFLKHLPK